LSFRQVDVGSKPVSLRRARARGRIKLRPETMKVVAQGRAEKGDPLALAKVTGIMAAKKTPEIVALCHQLKLDSVEVATSFLKDGIQVTATVTAHEKTGVEMEALVAVTAALLNIWDVVKQYEKDEDGQYRTTTIEGVSVTSKVKEPVASA